MRLKRLDIENFRRIERATIHFSPASFVVGPNNTGKSSVIAALEAVLSLDKEKLSQSDIREISGGARAPSTVLTAHFSDIEPDVASSRGFRGRVVNGEFVYRKSLSVSTSKPKIETQEYPWTVKPDFLKLKTVKELMDKGLELATIAAGLGEIAEGDKLPKDWHRSLPETVDIDESAAPKWVENPGGIPQVVLSKLPRLIHIPALTDAKELESAEQKHPLGECLALLFEDLVNSAPITKEIKEKLKALEVQMNPDDEKSLVAGLIGGVNSIVADVFPKCGIAIRPSLQELVEILKPKYDIRVFSNIHTGAARQGTGLIRTCAFAMLRYHAKLKLEKELATRPIIVAFEEPELFLHPSAANLLRDTIYALGVSDQIICTTHSPWMIDLSEDPQSITRMRHTDSDAADAVNYGVSTALGKLPADDKDRVKMLQIFDDELSRVFFAERVVVVEGDSEVLAIRQTMRLLPEETQKAIAARFQVVKARGKASIISLLKYLKELQIDARAMHDLDTGTAGAEVFNKPIADALQANGVLVTLAPNLETAMGYTPPSSDKPYKAYDHATKWANAAAVPQPWRTAMERLFEFSWPK